MVSFLFDEMDQDGAWRFAVTVPKAHAPGGAEGVPAYMHSITFHTPVIRARDEGEALTIAKSANLIPAAAEFVTSHRVEVPAARAKVVRRA